MKHVCNNFLCWEGSVSVFEKKIFYLPKFAIVHVDFRVIKSPAKALVQHNFQWPEMLEMLT